MVFCDPRDFFPSKPEIKNWRLEASVGWGIIYWDGHRSWFKRMAEIGRFCAWLRVIRRRAVAVWLRHGSWVVKLAILLIDVLFDSTTFLSKQTSQYRGQLPVKTNGPSNLEDGDNGLVCRVRWRSLYLLRTFGPFCKKMGTAGLLTFWATRINAQHTRRLGRLR